VGSTTQTIEVSGSTVQLQTESASVQKLITREQINSLELNGRNPIWLAALVPGARGATLASLNFGFTQGPSNFNGSRNPENLITFDGAPATRTRSNGTSLGAADVDSTQEVQILHFELRSGIGRTSGAQIRFTTKTGTNVFHGAAYEYIRNNVLNANTWARNANTNGLTKDAAPLHYNQFGFNIGGPFFIPGKFNTSKSKVFFYYGEEWLKYNSRNQDHRSTTRDSCLFRPSKCDKEISASCSIPIIHTSLGRLRILRIPPRGSRFRIRQRPSVRGCIAMRSGS